MDELAKRFAELAKEYGPDVLNAAKQAAVSDAYSWLTLGVELIGIGIIVFLAGRYVWRLQLSDEADSSVAHAAGFVLMGAGGIVVALGLWPFINPWTWIAMRSPELWIAKTVLHL